MPPPKGTRAIPFAISDKDAVHIYSAAGKVWLQLRRTVSTEQDIASPSFKVAVTLTPAQAIAIAGELLTAATHHGPVVLPAPVAAPKPAAAPPAKNHENHGRPWTEPEKKALLDAFDAGTPIPQIAEDHQRGAGGVQSQLVKLGRMSHEQSKSYPEDPVGDPPSSQEATDAAQEE